MKPDSLNKSDLPSMNDDPLSACVHCGLCLEDCPTYQLTGDENNSPRGRLLLWRSISEGKIKKDSSTDFYTDECVGCLACETACPADVPYGKNLEHMRHSQEVEGRAKIKWRLRAAGMAVKSPRFFNAAFLPLRAFRKFGLIPHPMIFKGEPAIIESTAQYANRMMKKHKPNGPSVALLTGCLMEAFFREINFATVRVLIENNVRVFIPEEQGCCGAFHEHTGMSGAEELFEKNRKTFASHSVDRVLSNSSGCGFALSKALEGEQKVQDVLVFLAEHGIKPRSARSSKERVYVDLPCHLIHGQKVDGVAPSVLNATGYNWELAPHAKDCCGSGGVYNIQKPDNATEILRGKSEFLDKIDPSISPILATSNHVCMMQWESAHSLIQRSFSVKHIIQLLDPGEGL